MKKDLYKMKQKLSDQIAPGDVELLEAAGMPEFEDLQAEYEVAEYRARQLTKEATQAAEEANEILGKLQEACGELGHEFSAFGVCPICLEDEQ